MTQYNVDHFPPIFVTTDIVFISQDAAEDESVLLIQRKKEPFKDAWALPGGFFDLTDATIAEGAVRELEEETGLRFESKDLKLIGVFSKKNRDPRESIASKPCRIISTAYLIQVSALKQTPKAHDDAQAVQFFKLNQLPKLAFDHQDIIASALKCIRP